MQFRHLSFCATDLGDLSVDMNTEIRELPGIVLAMQRAKFEAMSTWEKIKSISYYIQFVPTPRELLHNQPTSRYALVGFYLVLVYLPNVIMFIWTAGWYADGDMTWLWTQRGNDYDWAAARNVTFSNESTVAEIACGLLLPNNQFFLSTDAELTSELVEEGCCREAFFPTPSKNENRFKSDPKIFQKISGKCCAE